MAAELERRLVELATALSDELDVEADFASAFDSCFRRDASGGGGGGGGRGLAFALGVVAREVEIDLAAALSSFPTIDRGSIAVVEAFVGLQKKLGDLAAAAAAKGGGKVAVGAKAAAAAAAAAALPSLGALREQAALGWCAQLQEVLQTNLGEALRLEQWAVVYEGAPCSSSAVDVLKQLDEISQVRDRTRLRHRGRRSPRLLLTPLLPLAGLPRVRQAAAAPPAALQRFLDLLEMQLQKYVLSLYAECPPLPESALQSGVNAAAAPATPPPAEKLPPGTPLPSASSTSGRTRAPRPRRTRAPPPTAGRGRWRATRRSTRSRSASCASA